MKELESYLIKFDGTNQIVPKLYSSDYKVGRNKCQPVIVITNDKYPFLSNISLQFLW